jgi:hypothetical protein
MHRVMAMDGEVQDGKTAVVIGILKGKKAAAVARKHGFLVSDLAGR